MRAKQCNLDDESQSTQWITLWIAAPVQGTGYQFPQVKEQVPPVRRTGHQSRVKEQVTDFVIPLS